MAKRITDKDEKGYTRIKDGTGAEIGKIKHGARFPDFLKPSDVIVKPSGKEEEVLKVQYVEADDVYIVVSQSQEVK